MFSIDQVAAEIARRLSRIFLRAAASGGSAASGQNEYFQNEPYRRDYIPLYEYFNGDIGPARATTRAGTALIASPLSETRKD